MPAIVKPPSISWTEVFKRTWKEADEDDVFGRSAQLAYYFFLAFDLCYRGIGRLGRQGSARARGGARLSRKRTSWFGLDVNTKDPYRS